MKKIKEGDTVTLNLSGMPTQVLVKSIGFDGQIIGNIGTDTVIQFKIGNAQIPKKNIFKSFFSIGSAK